VKEAMNKPVKSVAAFLLLCLTLSTTSAIANTKSPKPTPTSKKSATVTKKAEPAATSKPSVKPKPKPKPKPKKKVTPSPKAKWPPKDFSSREGIYARVPTAEELVGILSASKSLTRKVEPCTEFVCGAVQVATQTGCKWWEVNSQVYSQEKELIGGLQTIASSTLPREIKTILLISPEPVDSLEYISNIEVVCHQEAKPAGTPSTSFTRLVP
jgi:hypothetical protein